MAKPVYTEPLKATIFDWAGTTVDYGCMAPATVFLEVFEREGVAVTMEQAREPMGLHKRDHIVKMFEIPAVAAAWAQAKGAASTEADVDRMFAAFVPLQLEAIVQHADIIPGAVRVIDELRGRGLKIGSTTGYNREMMELLTPEAARKGYAPDTMVCVSDAAAGRPAPWMAFENARRLDVYPMAAIVKVGDTPADIAEGLSAGMWTVGVVRHGNEVGLTEAEVAALRSWELDPKLDRARKRLLNAGAHYLADTIAEVPAVVDRINARLAKGERP
jgi:phosphonoacetaldehyde hydrolase